MNIFKKRDGEGRVWPHYIVGGRLRTSTAGLMLAFVALFWVNQNYQTEPPAPAVDPAQQVVPPGFVPDPNYTWVPRTNVQTREPEVTTTTPRTTTTTTTATTAPTTTAPDEPTTTSPGVPGLPTTPTTTVIDPDGPGPLSPQTFTQQAPSVPPSTVAPAAPTQTTTPPWP